MSIERPIVGVGAIVIRDEKVLIGLRSGSHGAGTWALPGGHLELGETAEDCARREVFEETGLELEHVTKASYVSGIIRETRRHYVTLFVCAISLKGDPQRLEPAKCMEWKWCRWDEMPLPLFQPLQSLVESGYRPNKVGCVE